MNTLCTIQLARSLVPIQESIFTAAGWEVYADALEDMFGGPKTRLVDRVALSRWSAEDKARQLAVIRKEGAYNPVVSGLNEHQRAVLEAEIKFRDQSEDRPVPKYLVQGVQGRLPHGKTAYQVVRARDRSVLGTFSTAEGATSVAIALEDLTA